MRPLESLTPKCRLAIDSARSPICATTASRPLSSASAPIWGEATSRPVTAPTAAAKTTPPSGPDHVLFGLKRGARRRPPNVRPAAKAPVSVAHTTARIHSVVAQPARGSRASQISAIDGSAIHNMPAPTSSAWKRPRLSTPTAALPRTAMASAGRGQPSVAATTPATTTTTIAAMIDVSPSRLVRHSRPHSQAINPAATATTTDSSGGPHQAAARPIGASTSAETVRCRSAPAERTGASVPRSTRLSARANGRAVSTIATMEILYRLLEVALGKIGPQRVGEAELRIGRLPEQEIADPLLAAGADDEIGIGHVGGQQMLADQHLVDRIGIEPAGGHLVREGARRRRDLVAAAIGQRDGQLH